MTRYVQAYDTHTPSDSVDSSASWTSRPFRAQAEHDDMLLQSVETGITAAGADKTDATELTKRVNIVATTDSGTGVILPVASAGEIYVIRNSGAETLSIYPDSGGTINGGEADAALTLLTTKTAILYTTTASTWFSIPGV